MGLFVILHAQLHAIPSRAWRDTFDESLELLLRYPIPLVGLNWEKTRYGERVMYSPVALRTSQTYGEHWRVEGDAASGAHAETFLLKRESGLRRRGADDSVEPDVLRRGADDSVEPDVLRRCADDSVEPDVLWVDQDDLEYFSGGGQTVLEAKTQQYPYHYAMLAVGMLFESRFPGRALVLGDITPEQARRVLEWTSDILRKPLSLPVIMDEARLWKRLTKSYGDDLESAVIRFSALYRGDYSCVAALCRVVPHEQVLERFVERELADYDSLDQLGTSRMMQSLVESVGLRAGLQMLDRLNRRRKKNSAFDFVDLAEALASRFITFDSQDKAVVRNLHPLHASLMNIEETMSRVFAMLGRFAAPDILNIYVSRDELVQTFRPFVPASSAELERKVDAGIAACTELLATLRKKLVSPENGINGDAVDRESPLPAMSVPDAPGGELPSGFEDVVMWEAKRQTIVRMSPEGWNDTMAAVRDAMQGLKDKYRNVATLDAEQDREEVLARLHAYVRAAGFAPLESTWKLIDGDLELRQLKALCILAMFKWDELHVSQVRRYIFDHPKLWPFLLEERNGVGLLPGNVAGIENRQPDDAVRALPCAATSQIVGCDERGGRSARPRSLAEEGQQPLGDFLDSM